MGFTFRGGNYVRRVWFGKRTVKEGECAVVWKLSGRSKKVVGPRRKRLFFATIKFLDRYQASPRQYIRVELSDGRVEHRRGPCYLFEDPIQHRSVKVLDAVQLDAHEAVVLYDERWAHDAGENEHQEEQQADQDNAAAAKAAAAAPVHRPSHGVTRRVLHGPAVFFPTPAERVVEFAWTQASNRAAANKNTEKNGGPRRTKSGRVDLVAVQSVGAGSPAAPPKSKLTLLQQPYYFDVDAIATQDHGEASVKVCLHLQLVDVGQMVDASADPIRDVFEALSADVHALCARRSYRAVLQEMAELLSHVKHLPSVVERARANGFRVGGVQLRSCAGSAKMRAVHAAATQRRLELKLQREADEAEQEQLDRASSRRARRAEAERAEAAAAARHARLMRAEEHAAALKLERDAHEAAAARQSGDDAARVDYLQHLHAVGVDLTKLLVSREYMKGAADSKVLINIGNPQNDD